MEEKTLITSEQNYWLAVLLTWGILELFGFYLYFIVDEFPEDEVIRYGMILGPLACGLLVLFMLAKVELAITNKRVYGRASFGRRVELPLDSVTAIGTSFMKGIAITTASGSIKFRCIKNRDEIYEVVSKLLMARQTNSEVQASHSSADELKKYKELLDTGVISQDEFDAKKKQLLSL